MEIRQFGDSIILEATPEEKLQAEAEWRIKNKRPWETDQGILEEVFAPAAAANLAERGIPPLALGATAKPSQDIHAGPGSYILRRNPITGAMDTVFHAPEEAKEVKYKVPLSLDSFGRMTESVPMTGAEIRSAASGNRLPQGAMDSETVKYVLANPPAPVSTNAPTARPSFGFIGTPGAANLFDPKLSLGRNPFMEGFNSTAGGKKLDAETARQFLQQSGGDKAEARRLAKAAGYDL